MNKINLSRKAQNDLAEIKRYISKELENPGAALNTIRRITQTIRILQNHTEAGALLSSVANVTGNYRFLVSGNYMIFYRINEHDIYVDRILYGRRDYLHILFEDKLRTDKEEE